MKDQNRQERYNNAYDDDDLDIVEDDPKQDRTTKNENDGVSRFKFVGVVVACIIVAIVIILLGIKGCTLVKKEEAPSNTTSTTVEENTSGNQGGIATPSTSSLPNTNIANENSNSSSPNNESVGGEGSMVEVKNLVFGDSGVVTAVVGAKGAFLVDGKSYAYFLNLVIPTESKNPITIKYFCPKKTYDGVEVNTSVKLEYQLDQNGAISITSVSNV